MCLHHDDSYVKFCSDTDNQPGLYYYLQKDSTPGQSQSALANNLSVCLGTLVCTSTSFMIKLSKITVQCPCVSMPLVYPYDLIAIPLFFFIVLRLKLAVPVPKQSDQYTCVNIVLLFVSSLFTIFENYDRFCCLMLTIFSRIFIIITLLQWHKAHEEQ